MSTGFIFDNIIEIYRNIKENFKIFLINNPEYIEQSTQLPKDGNLTNFIWISLDNRKKLFVQDSITKEKHYIDSPITMFDDRNHHGVENTGYAAWSLRVDGFFTDEFKSRIGCL